MNIMTRNTPDSWKLVKLGQLFEERKEKVSDKDYAPLSVTKQGIVPQMSHVAKSDDSDNRKRVAIGDFVINSRSDRKGSGGISEYDGSVSLISLVLEPREGHPRYFHHLLRSQAFQEEFYRFGHGIVADLWTTRFSEMKSILLSIPPHDTQKEIADFLDCETARIDQLIEKKEKFNSLLSEKRKNTISSAILGLESPFNSYAREEIKLKHVVELISKKVPYSEIDTTYIGLEHIKSWTGEIISDNNAEPEGLVSIFRAGDVLFGKLRPNLAKAALPDFDGACSTEALVLRPQKIFGAYLRYALTEQTFIADVVGSTYGAKMPRASWDFIGSQRLKLPDSNSQQKIVQHLDLLVEAFDQITNLTEKSIQSLEHLKTSIITEAVTGQLDIQKWQQRGMTDSRLDKIEEDMEQSKRASA
jgi:type I restriction enzyme S subunit